jgi:hypothetical protein
MAGVCEIKKDTLALGERKVPNGLVCRGFTYKVVRSV